jgi:stage II sporulation protein R
VSIHSYASTISSNLSDNFFRLHIIANSNSTEDQSLKLLVRDNIIEYLKSQNYSDYTKNEVVSFVSQNLEEYKKIAETTIQNAGFDYPVSISISNTYFPTKTYGNISLPAGFYDALKIEIGNATGQNWWCSLFPPLCFVDISSGIIDEDSKNNLKENLSKEEFAIITQNNQPIKLKFKIIEIFSN